MRVIGLGVRGVRVLGLGVHGEARLGLDVGLYIIMYFLFFYSQVIECLKSGG